MDQQDFECLTIKIIQEALCPEYYSRNKEQLDSLAFHIGIEQQEYKPKKESA